MITLNKSILLAIALSFTSYTAGAQLSCKSLLTAKIMKRNGPYKPRTEKEIKRDYKALEVIAAVAMASDVAARVYHRPIVKLRPPSVQISSHKYESVTEIKNKRREKYPIESYDFDRVSDRDKDEILASLIGKMEKLLDGALLGKDLKHRFGKDFLAGLLARNEMFLEEFLEANFNAILFNAAKMPNLGFLERVGLSYKKRALVIALASAGTGAIVEFFLPGFTSEILNTNEYLYNKGVYLTVRDSHFAFRMAANSVLAYGALAPARNYWGTKNIKYNDKIYDYKPGKKVRKDFVEAALGEQ